MKDLQTKIKKFNFSKNKIKKNVLIIGSGRWSKITIEEINKNFKCVKIFFYTKKKSQLSDWSNKKKIKIIQIFKLEEIKTYNITHAIVINKNKDHFNYTKKLLKMKVKTLVEKPIVENLSQFNKLYNISQKKRVNLLVSLPFFNALYFHYFKKFLKKKKITLINFVWTDAPRELRYGQKKRHQKINYFIDVIYHIHSIVCIFLKNPNISYNKNFLKIRNNFYRVHYNKILTEIFCNRNGKKRSRILSLSLNNKKKIKIDFTNNNLSKVFIQGNKYRKCPKVFQNLTLSHQIFNFLKINKYEQMIFNDVRNLKNFLLTKFKIQKNL